MKKFSILTVLVLSVLVVSGCSKKSTPVAPANNLDNKNNPIQVNKITEPVVATENTDAEESISGSMEDMLKKGKSLKCTFSKTEEGAQITATAYFDAKDGRYFAESEIAVPGTAKQVSYMMSDKTTSYMWLKGSTSGTKFVISESDKEVDNTDINTAHSDDKIDFKCKAWTVDNDLFKTPSNINFVDYTDNFNEVNAANSDIEANIEKYKELSESMPKK